MTSVIVGARRATRFRVCGEPPGAGPTGAAPPRNHPQGGARARFPHCAGSRVRNGASSGTSTLGWPFVRSMVGPGVRPSRRTLKGGKPRKEGPETAGNGGLGFPARRWRAAAVTRYDCRREHPSKGRIRVAGNAACVPPIAFGWSSGSAAGNAANPRIGSGMQQARGPRAEETVEVVQNHEGGTGFRGWHLETEARRIRRAGVDARGDVDGGANGAPAGPIGLTVRTNPTREGRATGQGDRRRLRRGAKIRRVRAHLPSGECSA